LEKYSRRKADVYAENVNRCFRLIWGMLCSAAGGAAVAGVHGGGSPVMEEIIITAAYDSEEKKKIVRYLAGIEK
jgi:4-hydroxyphenylacetate 3-monooxygenase/4-hydroxybutyryl-CoA dehydratase/vinylacetyl-CoA-Delta-isomerase